MTLDELLNHCRHLITMNSFAYVEPDTLHMARSIVALLGESQPCGMPAPDTFLFSDGGPGVGFGEDTLSADEARAFAAMLLRAADDAEQLAKEKP